MKSNYIWATCLLILGVTLLLDAASRETTMTYGFGLGSIIIGILFYLETVKNPNE